MFNQKNVISKVCLCVVVFALTGCEKIREEYNLPGKEEFIAFCKKDAGMTINQKVEVDGYFDDYENGNTAWSDLIKYGLEFIEFSLVQDEIDRHGVSIDDRSMFPEYWGKQLKVYTEPGYWRVSRAVLGSEACNPIIQEQITQWLGFGEKMDAYKKHGCFKVEKVDELKSKYGFYAINEIVLNNISSEMRIKRFKQSVVDLADGSILAMNVNYRWWPGPRSGVFGGAFPGRAKICTEIGVYKGPRNKSILNETISGTAK